MNKTLTAFGVVLAVATVAAQQPAVPIFRSGARLVVQTVTVKDKDGKPIEGLKAEDFIVVEDNVPQEISLFEYQRIEAEPRIAGDAAPTAPPPAAAPAAIAPDTPAPTAPLEARITPSANGEIKYRDRRLIVLYFDMTSMPPSDLYRAYDGAKNFIRDQAQPADLLALMSFESGAVKVKQDFSANREQLLDNLQKMIFGEDVDGDGIPDQTDTGTAFGQDDAEFNLLNTDRQLSALQTAANMLRSLPERKSLVYFASGLRLNGVDNQAQLRATTNAALRANVAIYPIDARGLVAMAPLGDASTASPRGMNLFTGGAVERMAAQFQRSQDSLYALAKDTGGQALLDYNDLSRGIRQAADAITSYYVLGYYSTHTALDGKFRRVKVSLRPGLEGELSYRQGYFADKEFGKFTAADKERQLEEALMLENPVTDITIAMEVNFFQISSAEYFIPVSVKIPGSELALARKGGAQRTLIDFIGEIKDDFGITIQNVRDRLDIRLSDQTAAQLTSRPVHYDTGFTLLPGKYVIKILARDSETGRIGTYQSNFTIPNLNREQTKLPISSVVLGSQREPLSDAIYTVQKNAALQVNPLVYDGHKLLPSVTRVFSRSRELYVYLQAYQRGATTTQPMMVFVTLYRGDEKVFESTPTTVLDGINERSKAVPMRLTIPLKDVPPGGYECQVTVIEPTGQKVNFWRAPIAVIP